MIRQAASVVLWRDRGALEVFLVERARRLAFFGGYHAFPGGAIEPGDVDLQACAVREVREETGVRLDPAALRPITRLVTPCFSRVRFDTRFFLARTDREPRVTGGELAAGAWRRPADVMAAWRRGDLLLAPPAIAVLRELERAGDDLDTAVDALSALPPEYEGSGLAIPWTAGYELLPLRCEPLPPELPMSTMLVGWNRFIVIDPGTQGAAEREHLIEAVGRRIDSDDRLEAIVLTHHHVDHVAALDPLLERFPAPVWAHRITGELLSLALDRELDDGDRIELGDDPAGEPGWELECVFTPGHAAGHLALHDPRHRALVAGDLVSTAVSMYVGSPGGHLGTYFESLERIRALDAAILYPSHGMPTISARQLIDRTIKHRKARLDEIERLVAERGEIDVPTVAATVYQDVPPRFEDFYHRAARASLEYLVETGRVVAAGADRFRPTD